MHYISCPINPLYKLQMSYLNFDKTLLVNLEKSLTKEMIRTNRAGAYNSTTLIDCNTRKYHGQLVVPLPKLTNQTMFYCHL